MCRCFPFESWRRNEGRSNRPRFIAHAQDDSLAGNRHDWLAHSGGGGALAGSGVTS